MFIFPEIAKEIFRALIEAEEKDAPITLKEALKRWGNGSTWEDLVDGGYVERFPKAVTVTSRGKAWLKGYESAKTDHTRGLCGKPDIPNGTPLEEAKKNPPNCLCCGTKMEVHTDGGSLEQLGVYVVTCPICPTDNKK